MLTEHPNHSDFQIARKTVARTVVARTVPRAEWASSLTPRRHRVPPLRRGVAASTTPLLLMSFASVRFGRSPAPGEEFQIPAPGGKGSAVKANTGSTCLGCRCFLRRLRKCPVRVKSQQCDQHEWQWASRNIESHCFQFAFCRCFLFECGL